MVSPPTSWMPWNSSRHTDRTADGGKIWRYSGGRSPKAQKGPSSRIHEGGQLDQWWLAVMPVGPEGVLQVARVEKPVLDAAGPICLSE